MLQCNPERCSCKYKEAFNNKHVPMLIIESKSWNIYDANPAACNYYGYSREKLLAMNITDIVIFPKESIHKEIEEVKAKGRKWFRFKHKLSDGHNRDVEVYSELITYNNQKLLFSVIYDMGYNDKLEKECLLNKVKFEHLFNNTLEAIAIVDKEFKILEINKGFERVFQYGLKEIEGKELTETVCDESLFDDSYGLRGKLSNGNFVKNEVRRKRKDGSLVDVLLRAFQLTVEGETIGFYCIYSDTSKIWLKEKQIENLRYIDSLTKLYNKEFFKQSISRIILGIKDTDEKGFAVVAFGINEYDEIVRALGNEIGDEILKEFARVLKSKTHEDNIAARIGSDVFAVIIPNTKDINKSKVIAELIKNSLDSDIILETYEINITTSVGISIYPDDGLNQMELIENAVLAMNKSMEKAGCITVKFENKLKNEVRELFWLKSNLGKALANKELFLNYQPIIDLITNNTIGIEALIRWTHKELGVVTPMKFIPLAEEIGIIHSIGKWVLYNACNQIKKWQELGYKQIYVSVNVSVLELERLDFTDTVKNILIETGLLPKYLQIEITETSFSRNFGLIKENVRRLREIGVKIAIDDFGTGYSSLEKLSELSINSLKVDRSFINGINKNGEKLKILEMIAALAENLKIDLIAEGVETEEQLKILKMNKCNIAQGYLFSRPVGRGDLEKFLKLKQNN
ncbi:EAL domain-containing protein [Tissierella sp. Yu-01]|uniref:EAL domain-containing protein n=1 Tax=Tissierella sp. Yu-01 TaxID=3035694 RepID=UPI00240DC2AF|nr:EAL domain-containing protein [Tissierella sp. Yu-01]WFA09194.1 EAL domain-containing protein [Tissierella sp. Yu-01]